MSERIYRMECDGVDLLEVVEKQCSQEDSRRSVMPKKFWPSIIENDLSHEDIFWTGVGYKKYCDSGLRDWQLSVAEGEMRATIAEMPEKVLYRDEFRIVCKKSDVKIIKEYSFSYEGPRPSPQKVVDERPENLRHYSLLRDWCTYAPYTGSDETFTLMSSVGVDLGLSRIGIHHEILKPNKRSSWPHAHKVEEELVYILKGNPDLWINGKIYSAKPGDFIFFPPETNFAHSILNNTKEDIEMMVLGEQDDNGDLIYYPLHPARNEECKAKKYFWDDRPSVEMGDHNGEPGPVSKREVGNWEYQKSYDEVKEIFIGDTSHQNKVYHSDQDLGRSLGAKRVALHRQKLPSGFRTSHPHAESLEEEFVYVLKGNPIVWINGRRYQMREGDSVAFASGTGIAHNLINESGEEVELLVAGETTKKENLCSFPVNPEMLEKSPIPWKNAPIQDIGPDSSMPELK